MNSLLEESVKTVPGIGEETEVLLNELGIFTVSDLLEYYPYRYDDYEPVNLAEVKHNERITVEGKVHSEPSLSYFGRKKSRIMLRILVENVLIKAVIFNRPFLKNQIIIGETVTITGKFDQHRQTLTINELHNGSRKNDGTIEPVYGVKGNLTVKKLRKLTKSALKVASPYIEEILPVTFLTNYKLIDKRKALVNIHFPSSRNHLKHARRRLVYEELLIFQLKMQALRKYHRETSVGIVQNYQENKVNEFIQALPFPLTSAQLRVVNQVLSDIKSPFRMNRLLQGDVGSGKTIVAAITMYAAVTAGNQAALMVPTEILAEQHFQSLDNLLSNFGLKVGLLTSSIKGKRRRQLLEDLHIGTINVLIGTHSLIQEDVNFHKLGLVITDEQHRFGVQQRRVLREKGESPDVLFMTATPIPRTLAITVFGDMDVSIIDEMPAGRKDIETYWVKHNVLDRVLDFISKEITKGRQAYVICPLIEESEKLDVQNAIDVYQMLTEVYKGDINVGLMHGRLLAQEKEDVMIEFSKNNIQVLVSTTVVEVGVNVPNATVMVIYDAERFGLSQLHQLRGRVGRGEYQSYCILVADPKSETGKERMSIMTETNDGFKLSEKDLELRGPGDFFGRKQSGVPEFKLADLVHDYRTLNAAREDAINLIESKSFWIDKQYEALRLVITQEEVITGERLD